MNCNCGVPARYTVSKIGETFFVCANGKCRFFAKRPVQGEGWTRIVLKQHNSGAAGTPMTEEPVVVRFEVLLHPESRKEHFTATLSSMSCNEVMEILENEKFQPLWYVPKSAYIYPIEFYEEMIGLLKRIPRTKVLLEEVPPFFFRCWTSGKQRISTHMQQIRCGVSQDADPHDVVYSQLHDFQKKGVDFIIRRGGRGMIADDMGLGKTVQAIAVAHHYRNEWPLLIVCPLSLVENWSRELTRFCLIPPSRMALAHTQKFVMRDCHSIAIVPYTALRVLSDVPKTFNVVILDESHFIKSTTAQRTIATLKVCKNAKRVLLLSGTPAISRPIELFSQLQAIVEPSYMPTKTQFSARYCNAFVGRFGLDDTGHSNMSELHALLQQYMIRRTKSELGRDLPLKNRQLFYLYIEPKERKALEGCVNTLRQSIKDGLVLPGLTGPSAQVSGCGTQSPSAVEPAAAAANDSTNKCSLPISGRSLTLLEMRHATSKAKLTAVQEFVRTTCEQIVESSEKVIFFAHHLVMIDGIAKAIESVKSRGPLDYVRIVGDTPAVQREKLLNHFRTADKCHIALLSMQTCGVGHNLTCATMVVFAELDWNPSTHLQCEDRVHRIGQSSPCFIKYLLAEGTSDSVIWPLLQNKLTVTQAVMEDRSAVGNEDIGAASVCGWGSESRRKVNPDGTISSSQPKRQVTLESFVCTQEAKRNGEKGEDGLRNDTETEENGTINVMSQKIRPSQKPETEAKPLFIDIPTLQKQRAAKKVQTRIVPDSKSKEQTFKSSPTTPSPTLPTRTLVSWSKLSEGGPLSTKPANEGSTVVSQPQKMHTLFVSGEKVISPNASSAVGAPCAAENGAGITSDRHAATCPSKVKKTSFVFSPTTPVHTSTIEEQFVQGVDDAVKSTPISFLSQEDAIRSYNSRRTPFSVVSVAEKRAREAEESNSTY
uniref:Uncharacterized protein TCIL3000_11_5500 n=1 Tax=Trypanosoma congolense (strain IL3000) TaxID=1068625 RepID=G0V0G5_TRYCI|nr:unnamed protein product [Trypanosoma congolense IL3000]